MIGAATIVIARDDLSIPASADGDAQPKRPSEIEAHFFNLVRLRHPDVIVLDCRGEAGNGVAAIQKIRRRAETPILVICPAGDGRQRDYRMAGASDCLEGPIDIVGFNHAIQDIIRVNGKARRGLATQSGIFDVAGLTFEPQQNELAGESVRLKLTTAENRLLMHLVTRPWVVCSRGDIGEVIYGPKGGASDRAIDVVVTRLRKKLSQLRGPDATNLIRTEFRQGYMFVGEATAVTAASRVNAPSEIRASAASELRASAPTEIRTTATSELRAGAPAELVTAQ